MPRLALLAALLVGTAAPAADDDFRDLFDGKSLDGWVVEGPDNPAVLHHGNMGFANLADGFSEANFITGQVPGGEPMMVDPGVGYRIDVQAHAGPGGADRA